MIRDVGKVLSVSAGRFWWVLVVHSRAGGGNASILRVVRGRSAGRSVVDYTFVGSFGRCREFLEQNGGGADGVLLVDDSTPVKVAQDGEDEFKREGFESVRSIDGNFGVVALRREIEDLADDVCKAGFKILAHVSALFLEVEMLRQKDLSEPKIFTSVSEGVSKAWLFTDGEILASYKVLCDNVERRLVDFVGERFFLKSLAVEEVFIADSDMARTVAEDAWLFRTSYLPAFSTLPDAQAVARIREAALFRRVFKACVGILFTTILVTLAFWGGVSWYAEKTEVQVAAFEKNLEIRKELERVWKKLEEDKAGIEKFLGHRSRMSSSFSIFAKAIPAGSWISHWTVSGNVHSLQGYSVSPEEVSKLLYALESERKLVNVRLRTTEKTTWKGRPVVRFNLTAEVIP